MSVHDTVARLHGGVREQLEKLWQRHASGEITKEQFLALAVAYLNKRIRYAETVADLAVAAELTRLRGELVSPTGMASEPDSEGVRAALLDQENRQAFQWAPAAGYAVAAAALVLAAFQESSQKSMKDQGVTFVVRVANPDACPVCRDLDGQTLPITATPYHHRGCACVQRPTES